MKSLPAVEFFVALFDTAIAALGTAMCCAAVVAALPPELVASSEPLPPSFDVAVPTWEGAETAGAVVVAGN